MTEVERQGRKEEEKDIALFFFFFPAACEIFVKLFFLCDNIFPGSLLPWIVPGPFMCAHISQVRKRKGSDKSPGALGSTHSTLSGHHITFRKKEMHTCLSVKK